MRCAIVALLALLYLSGSPAQDGFRLLRGEAGGFAEVIPGKRIEFPRDHAAHPDFRIEWWYITANLKDDEGNHWGLQWTLFRNALSPPIIHLSPSQPSINHSKSHSSTSGGSWQSNQLWMAHAAISTPDGHLFEQRFARGGIGQAGVSNTATHAYFDAWLDDWQWRSEGWELFPSTLRFNVEGQSVEMHLQSLAEPVLHGDHGYSQKSAQGQASYYYSQPDILVRGTIRRDDKTVALSGSGWLDREWSSQALAANQTGWDWFSLHLDGGNKLMIYRLREDGGNHWLSGSWIDQHGKIQHLSRGDIKLTPEQFREIGIGTNRSIKLPLEWTIKLPGADRQWRVKTLYDDQWMGARFSYWEGVVLVEDRRGESVGVGYMELTGYD